MNSFRILNIPQLLVYFWIITHSFFIIRETEYNQNSLFQTFYRFSLIKKIYIHKSNLEHSKCEMEIFWFFSTWTLLTFHVLAYCCGNHLFFNTICAACKWSYFIINMSSYYYSWMKWLSQNVWKYRALKEIHVKPINQTKKNIFTRRSSSKKLAIIIYSIRQWYFVENIRCETGV